MATHVLPNRNVEIALALVLLVAGCFLIWDCYDNSGKQLPWYARWFSFW